MSVSTNTRPLTVSQAMALAKGALESCNVTIIGEVSEVSDRPRYKAVYFTVKDASAALPCLMWKNRYLTLGVELRVGMRVQLTGRFTLYAAKGRMNFDVFHLAPAGEGELREKVAALARTLQREGLMAPEKKLPLPSFPQTIGLVTSPNGAAVHDVLRTLRRRYPLACIKFAGVTVEGKNAAGALVEGLDEIVAAGSELVLLVRGGGSFEDLMPFNDERLARAIAACPVPVVTGIGHEPDTSIADMVADLRASTPTAAAEACAPDVAQLKTTLVKTHQTLTSSLVHMVDVQQLQLDRLAARPLFTDPYLLLAPAAQTLDLLQERLRKSFPQHLERNTQTMRHAYKRMRAVGSKLIVLHEAALQLRASRLHDLSPLAVIERGYSLTRAEDGSIVRSVKDAPKNSHVLVRLVDGTLSCTVLDTIPSVAPPTAPSVAPPTASVSQ